MLVYDWIPLHWFVTSTVQILTEYTPADLYFSKVKRFFYQVKKLFIFNETQNFVIVLKTARHWFLLKPHKSTPHPLDRFLWKSILILSSHVRKKTKNIVKWQLDAEAECLNQFVVPQIVHLCFPGFFISLLNGETGPLNVLNSWHYSLTEVHSCSYWLCQCGILTPVDSTPRQTNKQTNKQQTNNKQVHATRFFLISWRWSYFLSLRHRLLNVVFYRAC